MIQGQSKHPGGSEGKESVCNAGDPGSIPGSERFLEGEWLPTPVFLPGEFHRGAWQPIVRGVARSQIRQSN